MCRAKGIEMEKRSKVVLFFMSCLALGMAFSASSTAFNRQITETATISFIQPTGSLRLIIVPKPNLIAGVYEKDYKVADFTLESLKGAVYLAVRWSLTGNQGNFDLNHTLATIYGKNNPENQIHLKFRFQNITGVGSVYPDNWYVINSTQTRAEASIYTSRDHTINADDYVMTLDAAIYTP